MLRIWPDVSDTVQLIIFYIHLVNFVAVSTLKGKLQTLTNEKKYIETELQHRLLLQFDSDLISKTIYFNI